MRKKFHPKIQLDEEKNELRNTLMYINSHSREIPKLHPKLLNVNQSFKYMQPNTQINLNPNMARS